MEHLKASALFDKYLRGETTAEENALVESWYLDEANQSLPLNETIDYQTKEKQIWLKIQAKKRGRSKIIAMWPRIRIAACISAAVAFIVLGVWFFAYREIASLPHNAEWVRNDVAPGRNGATITLSTGEVIQLDSAKTGVVVGSGSISYSSLPGTKQSTPDEIASLPGNDEAQPLTASTAPGQTYVFILPDGSKVWLNAATTLKFPSTFAHQRSREVEVDGEAYFEVFKNKSQPFVVKVKKRDKQPDQEITVLGTHFNVNAYANESAITTTLLEGAVKVTAGKEQRVLKPGFKAINSGERIKVAEADVESIVDWKNNEFILDNQSLGSSLKKIARWYDLELVYEKDVQLELETGGIIPRNSKLSSVLKLIESSGLAHFRLEGRKLYVRK